MNLKGNYLMKYILYFSAFLTMVSMMTGCTDEALVEEETSSKSDFNIKQFSEGYSVAFDMSVNSFGDNSGAGTRSVTDADIEEWESHIDPEEFRILFFDSEDRFLFESKTRWITPTASWDGGRRWRVGVPVFQYLSDGFDEHVSEYQSSWVMEDEYNWSRIAEIMRTQKFKVAILANRPSDMGLHVLSDFQPWATGVTRFGKSGPFWGPKNSVASYDIPEDHTEVIKKVFDLHHTQYDPYYENKSLGGGNAYDFIMTTEDELMDDGSYRPVPYMGAVSVWLHSTREVVGTDGMQRNYLKLPKGQFLVYDKADDYKFIENRESGKDNDQYIPMYGIQVFEPLTTWKKGTTYYLSEQSGSQTGQYPYKTISLLRSVVKLELRIPMYDGQGNNVLVNNQWAQICGINFMARNEPIDVWTPTNEIWKSDHKNECEWINIRDYGLYADNTTDYKGKLSWFYGIWKKENKWDFGNQTVISEEEAGAPYPRVFNPITQRVQRAMITDCYLPIYNDDKSQCYHRWIVYSGEKNMNDPNVINQLTSQGYITTFRVEVKIENRQNSTVVYNLPITDYSRSDNPIKYFYKEQNGDIHTLGSYPSYLESGTGTGYKYSIGYYRAVNGGTINEVKYEGTAKENYPYPLLRNHHYRLTLNIAGDTDDINVEVMNGERRIVGGIEFN